MEYQRVMSCDFFNQDCVFWVQLACAMVNGIIFIAVGGVVRELVHYSINLMMIV